MKKKIIFLSDLHLMRDKNENLRGCNTFSTYERIYIDVVKNHSDADRIFLMGDISQDGTKESYMHLINLYQKYPCKVPISFIPGNHDNKCNLFETFGDLFNTSNKIIEMDKWTFILLDTAIPPHDYGLLNDDELNFLKESLDKFQDTKVIILMHHHPFQVNTPLIDEFILKNNMDFIGIVSSYNNIRAILFGHVHQAVSGAYNQISYMSCPSTCFQFPFGTKSLIIDTETIAYRWLTLEDSNLLSGTVNIQMEQFV